VEYFGDCRRHSRNGLGQVYDFVAATFRWADFAVLVFPEQETISPQTPTNAARQRQNHESKPADLPFAAQGKKAPLRNATATTTVNHKPKPADLKVAATNAKPW